MKMNGDKLTKLPTSPITNTKEVEKDDNINLSDAGTLEQLAQITRTQNARRADCFIESSVPIR